MKAPFHSGSALLYGVMRNEQICIQRELRQSVSVAIRIFTKNDALAGHFHAPIQRGKPSMNNAHCIHYHVEFRNTSTRLGPAATSCGSRV